MTPTPTMERRSPTKFVDKLRIVGKAGAVVTPRPSGSWPKSRRQTPLAPPYWPGTMMPTARFGHNIADVADGMPVSM